MGVAQGWLEAVAGAAEKGDDKATRKARRSSCGPPHSYAVRERRFRPKWKS